MGHRSLPEALDSPAPRGLAARDAERVRKALAESLAENTRRACLGHWAAFPAWCGENGYFPAPAKAETVAAHLAALAETVSPSTLKVRRAAIGAAHRAAGLDDPTGSELVKRALAGLVRERAVAPGPGPGPGQAGGNQGHRLPAAQGPAVRADRVTGKGSRAGAG